MITSKDNFLFKVKLLFVSRKIWKTTCQNSKYSRDNSFVILFSLNYIQSYPSNIATSSITCIPNLIHACTWTQWHVIWSSTKVWKGSVIFSVDMRRRLGPTKSSSRVSTSGVRPLVGPSCLFLLFYLLKMITPINQSMIGRPSKHVQFLRISRTAQSTRINHSVFTMKDAHHHSPPPPESGFCTYSRLTTLREKLIP